MISEALEKHREDKVAEGNYIGKIIINLIKSK